MTISVLAAILFVLVIALVAGAIAYLRGRNVTTQIDTTTLTSILAVSRERLDRLVRDEFTRSREEARSSFADVRQEVNSIVTGLGDALRNEVAQMRDGQRTHLDAFADILRHLDEVTERRSSELSNHLDEQHDSLIRELISKQDQTRQEAAENRLKHRGEINLALKNLNDSLLTRVDAFSASTTESISRLTQSNDHQLARVRETFDERMSQLSCDLSERHDQVRAEANENRQKHREEIAARLKDSHESVICTLTDLQNVQKQQIDAFRQEIERMSTSNQERLDAVRVAVDQRLEAIQQNNSHQLDLMRETVDEKLNATLEKRLGDSFRQVSERLEQVHKGLGEMQALAVGVGDLKKVFANVKMRGGWGEVQLESLLEQMLTPDQFERNVRTKDSSRESVEFAVKLPGKDGDGPVYLPLDAKFPLEDYQRLVDAVEVGDLEAADARSKDLERRIKACARDIRDKYINVPMTTDFAIMFLPVEGLYAEVLRRAGLADELQRVFHVMIAGPTTLAAILSSLQMGFHTLAIEKRSSEVWKILGAVKAEFSRFGGVLSKVKKSLDTASNRIDDVAVRSRAIERSLKRVETLPETEAAVLLQIEAMPTFCDDVNNEGANAG